MRRRMSGGRTAPGHHLEALGHGIFYLTLRLFGHGGARLLLLPVVSCYLLCSQKIHRTLGPWRRHLFPQAGRWQGFCHDWRLVHSFAMTLVDRAWLGFTKGKGLAGSFDADQRDELLALLEEGNGAVLLLAHVGPWQSALLWLGKLPRRVHGLMHYDRREVARHYFDLGDNRRPLNIIDVEGPFGGMVEATAALGRGEVVAVMGDRRQGGPALEVEFFGEPVQLPATGFALAQATGAPLVVLLSAATGVRQLKVWSAQVWRPQPGARGAEKRHILTEQAALFAGLLEEYLRRWPYQWYNFYDFWKENR